MDFHRRVKQSCQLGAHPVGGSTSSNQSWYTRKIDHPLSGRDQDISSLYAQAGYHPDLEQWPLVSLSYQKNRAPTGDGQRVPAQTRAQYLFAAYPARASHYCTPQRLILEKGKKLEPFFVE